MRERKSAEARKAQIIEATLWLADKLGPERLTTETIAKHVGITQPGLFRHFPTKDQLWEAVARFVGARLEESWAAVRHSDEPASQQLRTLLCTQLRLIQAIPAIPAILFSRELHVHRESLRKGFYKLMQHFQKILTEIIARGCASGEFRPEVKPEEAALLMISIIQGTTLRWSLSGRTFDLVAEGEQLFDQLLCGLTACKRDPAGYPLAPETNRE